MRSSCKASRGCGIDARRFGCLCSDALGHSYSCPAALSVAGRLRLQPKVSAATGRSTNIFKASRGCDRVLADRVLLCVPTRWGIAIRWSGRSRRGGATETSAAGCRGLTGSPQNNNNPVTNGRAHRGDMSLCTHRHRRGQYGGNNPRHARMCRHALKCPSRKAVLRPNLCPLSHQSASSVAASSRRRSPPVHPSISNF